MATLSDTKLSLPSLLFVFYSSHKLFTKALGLAIFCVLGIVVWRLFFHPLSRIPGPFAAKITGLWRTYRYFNMSWHDDIVNLHRTYGPVVRIAPDEISVVDSKALKVLYNHGTKAKKTAWYNTWDLSAPAPILFSETNPAIHAALRRRLSTGYSMSALLKYEEFVQDCLSLCIRKIRHHASQGRSVNMSEWTHMLSFDIVGELTFGQKLGQLEAECDVDDIRRTNTSDIYWTGNFGHFWLQSRWLQNPIIDKMNDLIGWERPGIRFQNWAFEKVMRRKQGLNEVGREDLLAHFLNMKPLPGNDRLEDVEVLVEAANVIGAGADTTAIGMRSCLYFLCLNDSAYKRLQKEVDNYYASFNLQQPISFLQTQQLPYLKAVVSEATRLLPSIVYQLLRYVPEGGLTVNEHFIPAGTSVGISPIAGNRDKKVWGEDADIFRPERWLEDPERSSFLESHNMTYGGHGPRACIGRNLALVELHKFVAQIMYNFDFRVANPKKPWRVETYWFMDQLDFNLILEPRTH